MTIATCALSSWPTCWMAFLSIINKEQVSEGSKAELSMSLLSKRPAAHRLVGRLV